MSITNQKAIEEIKQMPDNAYPIVLTGEQAESFVTECSIMVSLGDLAKTLIDKGDSGDQMLINALTFQGQRLAKITTQLQDRI